jgi:hypothetical protein
MHFAGWKPHNVSGPVLESRRINGLLDSPLCKDPSKIWSAFTLMDFWQEPPQKRSSVQLIE